MTAVLRAIATLAVVVLVACSDRGSTALEVRARFDAFQTALRSDDEDRLIDLVTRESLPALEQIPPGAARGCSELTVDAVLERSRSRFEVMVHEATGQTDGTFVMALEDGAWRVDLVESAAATHGVEAGPPKIEPSGLSAEQIDGIRKNHRERVQ